jgi:hypothetical protein
MRISYHNRRPHGGTVSRGGKSLSSGIDSLVIGPRRARVLMMSMSHGNPSHNPKRDNSGVTRFDCHRSIVGLAGGEIVPSDKANMDRVVTFNHSTIFRPEDGDPSAVRRARPPVHFPRRRQFVQVDARSTKGIIVRVEHLDRQLPKGIVRTRPTTAQSRKK